MTAEHVERWIRQFDISAHVPLLRALGGVLQKTYFARKEITSFLENLIKSPKLTGANPCDFWRQVDFLRIQAHGHSQEELLAVFDPLLNAACGRTTEGSSTGGSTFIYLDDVLFSGNRIGSDVCSWLERAAPESSTLHIIVIAAHSFGVYKMEQRVKEHAGRLGKRVNLTVWLALSLENRKYKKNVSEVLWPSALDDDPILVTYATEQQFPFEPRMVIPHANKVFESEEDRQVLERQLLMAGMRIRSFSHAPSIALRPLGYGPFGLGFGSTVVTFRNCPNNTPLALWWGDPNAGAGHPLSRWYPLFPRKTYSEGGDDVEF